MRRVGLSTLAALSYGAFLAGVAFGPWWFWKWVIVGLCFAVGVGVVGLGTYFFIGEKE